MQGYPNPQPPRRGGGPAPELLGALAGVVILLGVSALLCLGQGRRREGGAAAAAAAAPSGTTGPAADPQDEADWQDASRYLPACRWPVTSGDCDRIKRYLSVHPQGGHASEASTVLQASWPRLRELQAQEQRGRAREVPTAPAPTSTPAPAPAQGRPGKCAGTVQCCDGSCSPTCTTRHQGCCSKHGGVCD